LSKRYGGMRQPQNGSKQCPVYLHMDAMNAHLERLAKSHAMSQDAAGARASARLGHRLNGRVEDEADACHLVRLQALTDLRVHLDLHRLASTSLLVQHQAQALAVLRSGGSVAGCRFVVPDRGVVLKCEYNAPAKTCAELNMLAAIPNSVSQQFVFDDLFLLRRRPTAGNWPF